MAELICSSADYADFADSKEKIRLKTLPHRRRLQTMKPNEQRMKTILITFLLGALATVGTFAQQTKTPAMAESPNVNIRKRLPHNESGFAPYFWKTEAGESLYFLRANELEKPVPDGVREHFVLSTNFYYQTFLLSQQPTARWWPKYP